MVSDRALQRRATFATRGVRLAARLRRVALLPLLGLILWTGCERTTVPEGALTFEREGRALRTLSLAALAAESEPQTVETNDPYYGERKRFRALPLAPLLTAVYGESSEQLRGRAFVLHALDGYAVPVAGERLVDSHAFLAIDDLDVPGFAPIGPRKVSPSPAYLIWEGTELTNLETHPRPWQLATIEMVNPESLHPHTKPLDEPEGSLALRGYHLFRERCIRCHAINREGGNVGPELNVPQSIVEYRPEAQIRAYITNPLTFRYGAMPPNPDLDATQLDALIAYFRAMASRKHDPAHEAAP